MDIQISHDHKWISIGKTMVRGETFRNGDHLSTHELAQEISKINKKSELISFLRQCNGFFSIIHESDGVVYLASDHIRSTPLYYAATDDIYISDLGKTIHKSAPNSGYDSIAASEQLFTEYVSGRETISKDVKQLQAGEVVAIDTETQGVATERWYNYVPDENSLTSDYSEFDNVMSRVFNRFLEVVNGRTVVLGLSEGYDSLLIALMLYRKGYENVVTYTRTRSTYDSGEVEGAKSIADDLGFEHLEIRHSHEDYRQFRNSENWEDFYENTGTFGNLTVPSGYVTLQKLTDAGIDPANSLVVRGHHAMGGALQLPSWTRNRQTLSKKEFLGLMWPNYSRWRMTRRLRKENIRDVFFGRVLDRISVDLYKNSDTERIDSVVRGIESWYWQERVPKLLLRDAEYDYFGYDKWIPLWDREYVEFAANVPLKDRIGKRAHKKYVEWLDKRIRGDNGQSSDESLLNVKERIGTTISERPAQWEETVRWLHAYHNSLRAEYDSDPRFGILSETEFNQLDLKQVDPASLFYLTLYMDGHYPSPDEQLEWALPYTQS